ISSRYWRYSEFGYMRITNACDLHRSQSGDRGRERGSRGAQPMSDTSLSRDRDDEPFDLEREPLDRPPPVARDWGGDGSDLSRPVRAHVLAALRPNTAPYPPPLDALRHLGDPHNAGVEERRNALGLGQEHLSDLLRMAR